MSTDRPDPGEFFEMAQRMLRSLFADPRDADPPADPRDDPRDDPRGAADPWAEATRRVRESFARSAGSYDRPRRTREPSPEEQRENLTFALATRAVEALEDLALNVAAIRQRLVRTAPPPPTDPA
jgi:hypothetical protein